MAKRKKAKAKAEAKRRKTKPVSKAARTSTVSKAKNIKRAKIRIMNERWEGKYNLVCDVNFEGRLISNVRVEALPPVENAKVYFPAGIELLEKGQDMIENAVLAYYYDVEV